MVAELKASKNAVHIVKHETDMLVAKHHMHTEKGHKHKGP